jgi:Ca2+-binding EF-hand superfamily protein
MLNYSDFLASFVNEKKLSSKENLKTVFKMIDGDGNGVVDKEELNSILNRHGLRKKGLKERNVDD